MTGRVSYHAGLAAEDSVARSYTARGHAELARRWRGQSGEIDLIFADGAGVIVVEVKKSRSFTQAAQRLQRRQMDRLCLAASEFIASLPKGELTEVRFDLALVDQSGAVKVIENAFGAL